MKILHIQVAPWDKTEDYIGQGFDINKDDWVIIDKDGKEDIAQVVSVDKMDDEAAKDLPRIKRIASDDDIARLPSQEEKDKSLDVAKGMANRLGLEMKFVDVCFSVDRSRINFAFIADGRVDFRSLVKEMIGYFSANIRLTQIGARDEARLCGDCGGCGRPLCCQGCIKNFSSVTSEMAEAQQIAHRGSDRISGMCGRLMCCLSYEFESYKKMEGELPPIGTKIKVKGRQGKVISHNILKHSVNARFEGSKEGSSSVVEIKID